MPQNKVDKLEQIGFKWLTRARPTKRKKLSDVHDKDGEASTDDDEEEDEPSPPRAPQQYQPNPRSPQRPLMGFATPARHWL